MQSLPFLETMEIISNFLGKPFYSLIPGEDFFEIRMEQYPNTKMLRFVGELRITSNKRHWGLLHNTPLKKADLFGRKWKLEFEDGTKFEIDQSKTYALILDNNTPKTFASEPYKVIETLRIKEVAKLPETNSISIIFNDDSSLTIMNSYKLSTNKNVESLKDSIVKQVLDNHCEFILKTSKGTLEVNLTEDSSEAMFYSSPGPHSPFLNFIWNK